jgi:DNA-3-methyladenine glycosylase
MGLMPVKKVLTSRFFNKPTLTVAKNLLGKFLVRQRGGKDISLMITEVEAYDGPNDKASHASCGKTERNKVMFGKAGNWYVYFTYGMHWMLNIVTGSENYPAAVLIRGTDKINGPARITKFLKIDKKFNGKIANKKSGLWIEDRGIKVKESRIRRGKRIGVDYAGKWATKPYRFKLLTPLKAQNFRLGSHL